MHRLLILPLLLLFAGCTTTSVSDFFAVETVPETQTGASKTGAYPAINETRVGDTDQLTDAQTAAEKQQLVQAAGKGRGQAQANNQAQYRSEVARLRRLARDQKQRRAEALKAASQ